MKRLEILRKAVNKGKLNALFESNTRYLRLPVLAIPITISSAEKIDSGKIFIGISKSFDRIRDEHSACVNTKENRVYK